MLGFGILVELRFHFKFGDFAVRSDQARKWRGLVTIQCRTRGVSLRFPAVKHSPQLPAICANSPFFHHIRSALPRAVDRGHDDGRGCRPRPWSGHAAPNRIGAVAVASHRRSGTRADPSLPPAVTQFVTMPLHSCAARERRWVGVESVARPMPRIRGRGSCGADARPHARPRNPARSPA